MPAGSWPSSTGKYVNSICPASTSCSERWASCGAYTANSLPDTKSGTKNGKPWMWSQCVWPMSTLARIGRGADVISAAPSARAPDVREFGCEVVHAAAHFAGVTALRRALEVGPDVRDRREAVARAAAAQVVADDADRVVVGAGEGGAHRRVQE